MAIDYAAKVAALEEAVGSGVLTIESNGERMTYRSMADLMVALRFFEGKLAASGTAPDPYATTLAVFGDD